MEWKYSVWKQGMRMGWVNLKMHQFISHRFKSFSHLFEALPAKEELSTKLWASGSRRPSSRKFHSASIDRPVFEPWERRWAEETAEMGGGKGSRIDLYWGMDLLLSLEWKFSLKDVLKQFYLILSNFSEHRSPSCESIPIYSGFFGIQCYLASLRTSPPMRLTCCANAYGRERL